MNTTKKKRGCVGRGLLISMLLGLALLVLIPLFLKGKIDEIARQEIARYVNADVDYSKASLSLIKNFPNARLRLHDLEVKGKEPFEGTHLASLGKLDFVMDIMSLFKSAEDGVTIKKIKLIDEDGVANYDIIKNPDGVASQSSGASTTGSINLKSFQIENGKIAYRNTPSNLIFSGEEINHSGSGDFEQALFDLRTKTSIKNLFLSANGVSYLNRLNGEFNVDLNIDQDAKKYTIKDNEIVLNGLKLNTNGTIINGETPEVNIAFDAPGNNIKELISIIPNAYTQNFDAVKANGTMSLVGAIKGKVSRDVLPAYNMKIQASNGSVQYPNLPGAVDKIFIDAFIANRSGNPDDVIIEVKDLSAAFDGQPIKAKLNLKHPVSDPDVDGYLEGKINLEAIARSFPIENVTDLSGAIVSDVKFKGRYSDVQSKNFDAVEMDGSLVFNQVNFQAGQYPKSTIQEGKLIFNPQFVEVQNLSSKLGSSDVQANGKIDNVLALFSPGKPVTGDLQVQSNLFNADEWVLEGEADDLEDTTKTTTLELPSMKINLDAKVNQLVYDKYNLKDIELNGLVEDDVASLNAFSMKTGKSDLRGKGVVRDFLALVNSNQKLTGEVTASSTFFDVNEFLETTTDESGSESSEFPFDRFDVFVDYQAKDLIYDVYRLKSIDVQGKINSDTVAMQSFSAKLGESDFRGQGLLTNLYPYLYKAKNLEGALNIKSAFMDADGVMDLFSETEESLEAAADTAFRVPPNFDLDIFADIEKLRFFGISMRKINGGLAVNNEKVQLDDVKANLLNGSAILNGFYATTDGGKPSFDMNYDLNKMDIQRAFKDVEIVKYIAPIAQFVQGTFNSKMSLKGSLEENMFPDLSSISGLAELYTFGGQLKGFKGTDKLAEKLQVEQLKGIAFENTKNWLEINQGKVKVKPFSGNWKDIAVKIDGSHGLNQTMDYNIQLSIPKELIGSNVVGSNALKGIDFINQQASKLGLSIADGDNVNLSVGMTGAVSNPGLKLNVTDVKKRGVGDIFKSKIDEKKTNVIDTVQKTVDKKVDETTEKVEEKVNEQVDTLVKKVEEKTNQVIDSLSAKAGDKAGQLIDTLLKDKVGGALDSLVKGQAKDQMEKVKKGLGDALDGIFKRKKKDGN